MGPRLADARLDANSSRHQHLVTSSRAQKYMHNLRNFLLCGVLLAGALDASPAFADCASDVAFMNAQFADSYATCVERYPSEAQDCVTATAICAKVPDTLCTVALYVATSQYPSYQPSPGFFYSTCTEPNPEDPPPVDPEPPPEAEPDAGPPDCPPGSCCPG